MLKILLHSPSVSEATQIKTLIEKHLPYEMLMSFNVRDTEDMLTSRSIQALFYDTQSFSAADFQFARELRVLGFTQPILIMATAKEMEAYLKLAEKHKIHFLEKPFEFKALRGIARKIMVQRSLQQQMYRRFRTDQTAEVETFVSGSSFTSQMFNLSKGGAYCEFTDRPGELSVGDLVRLSVSLGDMHREYTMNARVVWTTRKGSYSGGYGAGVKFVKNADIYRHLMEKM